MPRYLPPLAKIWWRTFEQPRSTDSPRRSRDWWQKWLLLMVLAQNISHAVPTTPSAPQAGTAKGCPSLPCPLSPERTTLLHSVIHWLLRPGPVLCLATLHLKESKAVEMCTADGRNYLAHLTSEIFFFLFLLSLPFPQITPRLGKLIDSSCTLAFDLYMEDFCSSAIPSWYPFSWLYGFGIR